MHKYYDQCIALLVGKWDLIEHDGYPALGTLILTDTTYSESRPGCDESGTYTVDNTTLIYTIEESYGIACHGSAGNVYESQYSVNSNTMTFRADFPDGKPIEQKWERNDSGTTVQCPDMDGSWISTFDAIDCKGGNHSLAYNAPYDLVHNGCYFILYTDGGGFGGLLNGNSMSLIGDFETGDGKVYLMSSDITISNDANSFSGSIDLEVYDGVNSCNGLMQLSAYRE